MLSLVLFAYDPIAVWTLVVAVATLAATVGGVVFTVKFGRKASTQEGLARVEEHVSHLPEVKAGIASLDARMKRQEETAALASRVAGVSISVRGDADLGQPLPIYLTTTEPTIHLTRVEFRTEAGNVFGQCECIPTKNLFEFIARLPYDRLSNWRSAGTPEGVSRTRHILRVWMHFGDESQRTHKDMAVTLTSGRRDAEIHAGSVVVRHGPPIYSISGSV